MKNEIQKPFKKYKSLVDTQQKIIYCYVHSESRQNFCFDKYLLP